MEYTRSQEKVLDVLKHATEGMSAQDIYVALHNRQQRVGLATVYRSLDGLKLRGTIQVRTLATGESLYSYAQQDRHHFTCLQCHISLPIAECPVEALEAKLQSERGLRVYYHHLEFFGLCETCANGAIDLPVNTHQHVHI